MPHSFIKSAVKWKCSFNDMNPYRKIRDEYGLSYKIYRNGSQNMEGMDNLQKNLFQNTDSVGMYSC